MNKILEELDGSTISVILDDHPVAVRITGLTTSNLNFGYETLVMGHAAEVHGERSCDFTVAVDLLLFKAQISVIYEELSLKIGDVIREKFNA